MEKEGKFVLVFMNRTKKVISQVLHMDTWRLVQDIDPNRFQLFDSKVQGKCYVQDFMRHGTKSRMKVMPIDKLKRNLIKRALTA